MATKLHQIPPLVSTHFLHEQMKSQDFDKKFRIIDATWDLPSAGRNPRLEHIENRIPGSRLFGIDDCCDKQSNLPHMLPSVELFEKYITSLGVSNEHHIVIYDNSAKFGLFSAPRVWWTFRVFGHDAVSVLDGGLPKWMNDGYPTANGEYIAKLDGKRGSRFRGGLCSYADNSYVINQLFQWKFSHYCHKIYRLCP